MLSVVGKWVLGLIIVSLTLGHIITHLVITSLRKKHSFPEGSNRESELLGCLERFAYTLSIVMNHPSFIGVWLSVKMFGRWTPEGRVAELEDRRNGSIAINIFLIGNLISLMSAVLGAVIIGIKK